MSWINGYSRRYIPSVTYEMCKTLHTLNYLFITELFHFLLSFVVTFKAQKFNTTHLTQKMWTHMLSGLTGPPT